MNPATTLISLGVLVIAILAYNSAWNASQSIIGTYLSGPATQSSCGEFGPWVDVPFAEYCITHVFDPFSSNPNGNMFGPQQLQGIKTAFSQVSAYQKILNDSVDFGTLGCAGMFFGLVIMTRDRVEYIQRVVRTTVFRVRRESR